jgi:hypothetical protein
MLCTTFVNIPVSDHFSVAKITHTPDRFVISRSGLNSMILTQVHIVLGTIKGHSKMGSFFTQRLKLRECANGMLSTGMSYQTCCQVILISLP